MCMFCTTIPAVLTLGVAAESTQRQAHKAALARGQQPPRRRPFLLLAISGVMGLLIGSVFYHRHFGGV